MSWLSALLLVICVGFGSALPVRGGATEDTFRVILLGSGSPIPAPERFGPATLVEAGPHRLLFDAGRGATIRLYQLGVPFSTVDPLFLTHLHSDHTVGIPDLWLTGWLGGWFGHRARPMRVIGPTGTKELMAGLERAYAADIRIRIADEHYPADGAKIVADEFTSDGVVFDREGVKVTAFEVDHGEFIKPAYGYRIDYHGHAVVISGDTRPNDNVVRYATDADVLIHEVAAARPELLKIPQAQRVIAHHTSPADAARVFTRAHPKLAVYTHIVLLARPSVPAVTIPELVAQTRETYGGPLEIGEDLMMIDIGDGQPLVKRHATVQ
jgi:ribonuclease Z